MPTYTNPVFDYRKPPELAGGSHKRKPVVIVGAGPVGMTAALDLASRDVPVVILDEDNTVSIGSRAICWSKRTLEIWDRLGIAPKMMEKGVTWDRGKVFFGESMVYDFNVLAEPFHQFPAFINLQQYHVEEALVRRMLGIPQIDVRWKNKVVAIRPADDQVALDIETPDGKYTLFAEWVIAADGVRSPLRTMMGLEFPGQAFNDRFLIADVHMKVDFPTERWFWFDPPFHRGQSVLLHKQADDVWRIDFQLGSQADPELERREERVTPRLRAMLGEKITFAYEWLSVYSFNCRCMDKFNHGRVLFAGDAAHVVSPFGARGGNTGVADADNLVWKLALVIDGQASTKLLDSYSTERVPAARENIEHSTRSTDFITPKSPASLAFRDAALSLAADMPFARAFVNSGRLSHPSTYADSPLNTPDSAADEWPGGVPPGAPAIDAPVSGGSDLGWLLDRLGGRFTLMMFARDAEDVAEQVNNAASTLFVAGKPLAVLVVVQKREASSTGQPVAKDSEDAIVRRYDMKPGTCYLIRPDQYVVGRWRQYDAGKVARALKRVLGA